MPGGTAHTLALPQTGNDAVDRALDVLAEPLRDSQTDLTRQGRLLTGQRLEGITIAAGASVNLDTGLGRAYVGGFCAAPMSADAHLVWMDRNALPAALAKTHVRLVNPGAGVARFYWWIF